MVQEQLQDKGVCRAQLYSTGVGSHQSHFPTALVEALMGFQFNHVGGGTKTRRPITLHMKYNSACVQPNCYLLTEDFGEQEVSLEELQVLSCHMQGLSFVHIDLLVEL